MTKLKRRPPGSKIDDRIIGFMCGLLMILGPQDARYLARLAIKFGQVPPGGTDVSRVSRLARKIHSGNYRTDTKEYRNGLMLAKSIDAAAAARRPDWGPPLMDFYDTSECASISDAMKKLTPRRRGPNPKLRPRRGGPKPR